ncbi:hypothetical protein ACVW0Y_003777 [Pseudomonas sp. TE3786]
MSLVANQLELEGAFSNRIICNRCITDYVLRRHCLSSGVCIVCSETTQLGLSLEQLAALIREYLPKRYEIDIGLYRGYELSLAEIIGKEIGCTDKAACEQVALHLVDDDCDDEQDDEEDCCFYSPFQAYLLASSPFDSEEDLREWLVREWYEVSHHLAHGRRFFNDSARSFMRDLFTEALNVSDPNNPGALAAIRTLPVGTVFHRARIAKGPRQVELFQEHPARELGAPPPEFAANNRMSPAGISLMYTSADAVTCVAEVRPSIGQTVVVGEFRSTRALTFFDFTALSRYGSVVPVSLFDPDYEKRTERRQFLAYLHEEIARPVSAQDTDYLMTQALAEYIRHNDQVALDGVMFGSVQNVGGVNFVLFDQSVPGSAPHHMLTPQFDMVIDSDSVKVTRVLSAEIKTVPM